MHVFIGGFQKCGTTTLHESLTQTGMFSVGQAKEMHYFDTETQPSKEHYLSNFEVFPKRTLDSTPIYAFLPFALRHIKVTLPDAKLLLLTRDPVSRSISHYYHEVVRGYETRDLLEALEADVENSYDRQFDAVHYSYIKRSCYAPQISRAKNILGEENVFVSSLTALRNSLQEPEKLARFLDDIVDGASVVKNLDTHKSNVGWYLKKSGLYPKLCAKAGLRHHGFLFSQILMGNVTRDKVRVDNNDREQIAQMIARCTDNASNWGGVFHD